jgi:hypothetical protein
MSVGSLISARAIATRCCWPPDKLVRVVIGTVGEADQLQRQFDALAALAPRQRVSSSGSSTFSNADSTGIRL